MRIISGVSPADYIERLMRRRLNLIGVAVSALPEGFRGPTEVPATPRLLLVREGSITFHIEGRPRDVSAGGIVLIMPWARRQWRGPAGTQVSWCQFTADEPPGEVPGEAVIVQARDVATEAAAFERMRDVQRRAHPNEPGIEAEGELKAILGRFAGALDAAATPAPKKRRTAGEAGVRRAIEWLAAHYREQEALSCLPGVADLTPKHFRECFRRRMGMSPRRYLTTLRMRTARFYLLESAMQVKQVAAAVGYDDPLYFSKLYHQFWGKSPTEEASKQDA